MAYKSLNTIVSIDETKSPIQFKIEDNWTISIPNGASYFIDDSIENNIFAGGLDLSGSIKPLIIRGSRKSDGNYSFELALERHFDFEGRFQTIDDIKYDKRDISGDEGCLLHVMIIDEPSFAVDAVVCRVPFFGTVITVRIRSDKHTAFNLSSGFGIGTSEREINTAKNMIIDIAKTIRKVKLVAPKESTAKKSDPDTIINNGDFIIKNTVISKYIGSGSQAEVPHGITEIADNAFHSASMLTRIILPSTLKKIGANAFSGCVSMQYIELPDSVEDVKSRAFENCFEIRTVRLSTRMKTVSEYMFVDCHALTHIEIPDGIKRICNSAFSDCTSLQNPYIPQSVTHIEQYAFKNCSKITHLVLPEKLTLIGAYAFAFCQSLTYLFIPASVNEIENSALSNDTPFYESKNVTIYCPVNSFTQSYAISHGIRYINAATPDQSHTTKAADKKQPKAKNNASNNPSESDDFANVTNNIDQLKAQLTELENLQLSKNDRVLLDQAADKLSKLNQELPEVENVVNNYSRIMKQKAALEEKEAAEKSKKMALARKAGKDDKFRVDMFIAITNEILVDQKFRNDNEFYQLYHEDFASYKKAELLKLRREILSIIEDESQAEVLSESFKKRSLEERFEIATSNLFNINTSEIDVGKGAEFAIEHTSRWFKSNELPELRRMMKAKSDEIRSQIDGQLRPVDTAWTKYQSAKSFLYIKIEDKSDSEIIPNCSRFQVAIDRAIVTVTISTKGFASISMAIMNCLPWYWSVTVKDIWQAAMQNDIKDDRWASSDGARLARRAYNMIIEDEEKLQLLKKQRRVAEYWLLHIDKKASLEKEKASLQKQILSLETEVSNIPELLEREKKQETINKLSMEKAALGIFRFKEKKIIQMAIDTANAEMEKILRKISEDVEKTDFEISKLRTHLREIETELTQDR